MSPTRWLFSYFTTPLPYLLDMRTHFSSLSCFHLFSPVVVGTTTEASYTDAGGNVLLLLQ